LTDIFFFTFHFLATEVENLGGIPREQEGYELHPNPPRVSIPARQTGPHQDACPRLRHESHLQGSELVNNLHPAIRSVFHLCVATDEENLIT
jgi:hypothetical protein